MKTIGVVAAVLGAYARPNGSEENTVPDFDHMPKYGHRDHSTMGIDDDVMGDLMGWHSTVGQAAADAATAASAAADAAQAALACIQPGTMQRFPPRPAQGGGFMTKQPPWRAGQYAPGVHQPREHLTPLPLTPDTNNGIFTSAITLITFRGRPQKPFRGERMIATVLRSGATAAGVQPVSTSIFVGTDLQQSQTGNIPVDIWAAQAFGVRQYMSQAQPGIDVTVPIGLIGALTAPDTITITLTILGSDLR